MAKTTKRKTATVDEVYDQNVRDTRIRLIIECRHMAKRLTNVEAFLSGIQLMSGDGRSIKFTNELREMVFMARESATILCRHLHEHNLDK